jgi:hypothetical protein
MNECDSTSGILSQSSGAAGKRKLEDTHWHHEVLGGVRVDESTSIDSWKHSAIMGPVKKPIKPFNKLSKSRKYGIMKELKSQMFTGFSKYAMDDDDSIAFLNYVEGGLSNTRNIKSTTVIEDQLTSLKVSDRQLLIRLLTHRGDAMNDDILDIFPTLKAKSELYLEIKERKTREDKIDLQFVSDFMHEYCRYAFL